MERPEPVPYTLATAGIPATLAILCGGMSQRFGTDKGLYAPLGDETLTDRAVRLWGEGFAEILLVVRDADQAQLYRYAVRCVRSSEITKVRLVHDAMQSSDTDHGLDAGPSALVGVATALRHARNERIVIVPVDQIGVRALHLQQLLKADTPATTAVAFGEQAGDLLPFPSIWAKHALSRVTARITARGLSVRGTLHELSARWVATGEWQRELKANANTLAEAQDYFGSPLLDPHGRRLHYLRFSLTEACNLSCRYCLPEGFPEWYRHKARLDKTAIATLTRGFRRLGFRKIRLTGGEPTVHPGCLDTVRVARQVGYEEIAMTTNGLLVSDIGAWRDAGLTHLNVSLDSLHVETFQSLTGSSEVHKVRRTIEEGLAAGLKVKVNTVLMRSRNGSEQHIRSLIEWALERPLALRFIELMDTHLNRSFAATERVYGHEIAPLLAGYGLEPVRLSGAQPLLGGPATDYASAQYRGRIGLINPLSCNFCGSCNRLRVTARGGLKLCLFGEEDIPLDLSSPQAASAHVRQLIGQKPEKHHLEQGRVGNVATFRTIGG